ncbi:hypothetical protein [Sphingobium cupriresistens]|uniref:hypothetical protein n=1 Tax=Sphingobium cupriresistens TaxID=1132417 RepID=UPI001A930050|nr:hypothetical protein [Sphingobium cupriresistens]
MMGLGKIARGAGKVGMLIEGLGYIVTAARALVRAIKGDPAARRDEGVQQDQGGDRAG